MKKTNGYIIAAAGIILFLSGLYFLQTADSSRVFMTALPYVCIGAGCGIFGYGISTVISAGILQKSPALQKQMEINSNDERNIMISNCAKAKAYDLMTLVFAALMLIFVLMDVNVIPVLLFVSAYLLLQGYALYCRCRYEKKM